MQFDVVVANPPWGKGMHGLIKKIYLLCRQLSTTVLIIVPTTFLREAKVDNKITLQVRVGFAIHNVHSDLSYVLYTENNNKTLKRNPPRYESSWPLLPDYFECDTPTNNLAITDPTKIDSTMYYYTRTSGYYIKDNSTIKNLVVGISKQLVKDPEKLGLLLNKIKQGELFITPNLLQWIDVENIDWDAWDVQPLLTKHKRR